MTSDAPRQGPLRLEFAHAWDYGSALEAVDRAAIGRRWDLFIGGKWKAPRRRHYVSVPSPGSLDAIAEVAQADAVDLSDAVRAARRAYDQVWSRTRGAERTKILLRLARAIEGKARELAVIEALNAGRPIAHARDLDLPLAVSYFGYYAGWADKLEYARLGPKPAKGRGVVAQLVSSACPLLTAVSSLAPALACGNTVVLEAHAATALSALALAQSVEQAGLPPGVVNIVIGETFGEALSAHGGIDVVAFAGDDEHATVLTRAAAAKASVVRHVDAAPAAIVFADAALDQAVDGVARGLSLHLGPAGCCAPVLLVEESVHDRLVGKLRDRMATLRVGDPLDPNTDVGPLRSKESLDALHTRVTSAQNAGAERFTPARALPDKGYWFEPTLLTKVSPLASVVRESVAAPILPVLTFRTPDEAIETANSVAGARCTSVWTEKESKALYAAQRLKATVIWRNTYGKIDASSPFGSIGGRHGLVPYMRES